MKKKTNPIKELFRYKNGKLFWRKPQKHLLRTRGSVGSPNKHNKQPYYQINLKGKTLTRAVLVWMYFNNKKPKGEIHHINGNSTDDRIENLKEASHSFVQKRKKSYGEVPHKYIYKWPLNRKQKYYVFQLQVESKRKRKNARIYCKTLQDAIKARNSWLKKNDTERYKIIKKQELT